MRSTPPDGPLPLPVVVLTGVDADHLAVTTPGILMGMPGPVSVRYELDAAAGAVHRVVSTLEGTLEDVWTPMEHLCMTCALRYEIAPTVDRLAETGRYASLLLTLPPAAIGLPIVRALESSTPGSRAPSRLRVASVVATTPGPELEHDLFGDDLLCERYDGLEHDRRAVGEVLADQLELADVVVSCEGPFSPSAAAVLAELVRPDASVLPDTTLLDPDSLLTRDRDPRAARRFVDPVRRVPSGADRYPGDGRAHEVSLDPASGVWTVFLDSWKPFHPDRLHAELEALGSGPVRGRGCFWLPGRPGVVAEWSGSGGQLSIGAVTAP